MSKPKLPTWMFGVSSGVLALAAVFMFITAISTASLHFGHCGPSSLSSPELYCRGASQLLIASYVVFAAAVGLTVITIWLDSKRRGKL